MAVPAMTDLDLFPAGSSRWDAHATMTDLDLFPDRSSRAGRPCHDIAVRMG